RTAEDKFATHQAFAAHGVPQPRTFHTMSPLTHKQLILLGPNVFVKENGYTSGGKGVQSMPSTAVNDVLGTHNIAQQEFIPEDGVDYKYVVVGDKIVYAAAEKGRAPN